LAFRDGAEIVSTENVAGLGAGVGEGSDVTVAVTVGELVAMLLLVGNKEGVGVWIEGWLVALPGNVRLQAKREEIIMR